MPEEKYGVLYTEKLNQVDVAKGTKLFGSLLGKHKKKLYSYSIQSKV